MRVYRISAILLLAAFGALSAANTPTAKMYSSHHLFPWSFMIDSCRLKVETNGAVISFQPVGSSITQFQSALADFASAPVTLKTVTPRGNDVLTETLKITYSLRDGEIVPEGYSLTRDYKRDGRVSVETFVSNCSDLAADSSI
jgi:hypothetical protein